MSDNWLFVSDDEDKTFPERLRDLLEDGEYHSRKEIVQSLGCSEKSVPKIVLKVRRDLPKGELIVCEYVMRSTGYRHVKRYRPSRAI